MEEQEVRKSVKDLVKTFDTNPKKELKTNQKKEKIPLFPTLKKLPSNVSNKYTEEVNQSNNNNDNKIPRKSMPLAFYKDPEKNDEEENPFKALIKNQNNSKVKDDTNTDLGNKISHEINPDLYQVSHRRKSSYTKKREIPKTEINEDNIPAGDIPEVDEPVVPLTYKETEELLKDPKFSKVKELKEITDREFNKTVTNKTNKIHSNIVKSLVSQDKTRFNYDGFDLDLTYITTKIIAMGFPSTSIEGIYRNNMEDVKNFFAKRHPDHYKVYNLCDDKKYSKDCFYRQGYYPFQDHEAPPLNLIKPFCEDAKKFLDEDEKNVVAIHCKAGKGRTGTFICCLLLYMEYFETAEECLLYYGLMRVGTVKGVTVPSQIRYVHYFESILKKKLPHPITFKNIIIRKIKMYTVPKVGKKKFMPNFTIENQKKNIKYIDINKKREEYSTSNYDLPFIEFPMSVAGLAVCGDVKVTFYQWQMFKKDKLFKFWFNTNFLPSNGVYEIKKEAIDKACKDKKCKVYKEDFKIEIEYIYI